MAADWLIAAIAAEGLLNLGLAVYLLLRGARTLSMWALAAYLGAAGSFMVYSGVAQFFTDGPPISDGIFLLHSLLAPAWVLFALTYPYRRLDRIRTGLFLLWLVPTIAMALSVVFELPWAQTLAGIPSPAARRLRMNLATAGGLLVTLVFADIWLRSKPSRFRQQFLFFLIASLFWNLNDAMPGLLRVPKLFDVTAPAQTAEFIFIAILQVFLVLGFLAILVWRGALGTAAERRDSGRLLVGFLFLAPLCALQLVFPERAPAIQLALTGFALPLIFYGAAKHTIVRVELHVQDGIRGGLLGFAGLGVLFVIEQAIEQWLGAQFGFFVGLAAAAGVVIFLSPLRRAAERVSQRVLPDVERTDAYLISRRLEVYEVALEGMLHDGVLDAGETEALGRLREQLLVPLVDHDRIEAAIRARLSAAAAKPGETPAVVSQP